MARAAAAWAFIAENSLHTGLTRTRLGCAGALEI